MSVESVSSSEPAEVIELFGIEALIRRRKALHAKLGELSVNLNEITVQYNNCIKSIIETNTALAAEGVDSRSLSIELQSKARADSAVEGYGHPDY